MTELPDHRDDEIVSAVLDGEATADERARVDADPELQGRLDEMRLARDAVAAPVDPLDELSARRLVDRALAAASSDGAAAPTRVRGGANAPSRWRDGRLIGLGSAAAVVVLALLVGPGLLSVGDDDAATDFATVAGDMDDSRPEALSDGESLEMEEFGDSDAADAWEDDAAPPDEADGGPPRPQGLAGSELEWLGIYETFDDLLAEVEVVIGRQHEAGVVTGSRSTYGWTHPECTGSSVDDGEWAEALVGPFALFDAVVDGRSLVVILGTDDSGEPAFAIVDVATCSLVYPS